MYNNKSKEMGILLHSLFVCPIQAGRRNTDGPHTLCCGEVFTTAALLLLALGTDMHTYKYLHIHSFITWTSICLLIYRACWKCEKAVGGVMPTLYIELNTSVSKLCIVFLLIKWNFISNRCPHKFVPEADGWHTGEQNALIVNKLPPLNSVQWS